MLLLLPFCNYYGKINPYEFPKNSTDAYQGHQKQGCTEDWKKNFIRE
ncbi:MAG TPA: hypothetical protein PKN48_01070 [Bacteroidales bacterium]|nr:hypothetical protein [Bacteroidales bacterium]